MKSATVMGPRSRIRCRIRSYALRLFLRDGDEGLLSTAHDEQERGSARRHLPELAARLVSVRHRTTVDARDDVAGGEIRLRRGAARFDVSDDRPAIAARCHG